MEDNQVIINYQPFTKGLGNILMPPRKGGRIIFRSLTKGTIMEDLKKLFNDFEEEGRALRKTYINQVEALVRNLAQKAQVKVNGFCDMYGLNYYVGLNYRKNRCYTFRHPKVPEWETSHPPLLLPYIDEKLWLTLEKDIGGLGKLGWQLSNYQVDISKYKWVYLCLDSEPLDDPRVSKSPVDSLICRGPISKELATEIIQGIKAQRYSVYEDYLLNLLTSLPDAKEP